MSIECYKDSCIKHASHGVTDPDECEGPVCFEEKCTLVTYHVDVDRTVTVHNLFEVEAHDCMEAENAAYKMAEVFDWTQKLHDGGAVEYDVHDAEAQE